MGQHLADRTDRAMPPRRGAQIRRSEPPHKFTQMHLGPDYPAMYSALAARMKNILVDETGHDRALEARKDTWTLIEEEYQAEKMAFLLHRGPMPENGVWNPAEQRYDVRPGWAPFLHAAE